MIDLNIEVRYNRYVFSIVDENRFSIRLNQIYL